MSRHIDIPAFAAAHRDGAVVIDVREPMEYVGGHVPGARLIPMGYLPSQASTLPSDRPVYLICQSGNRSAAMADYLTRVGLDAVTVDGGTGAWRAAGHPVVTGQHATAV